MTSVCKKKNFNAYQVSKRWRCKCSRQYSDSAAHQCTNCKCKLRPTVMFPHTAYTCTARYGASLQIKKRHTWILDTFKDGFSLNLDYNGYPMSSVSVPRHWIFFWKTSSSTPSAHLTFYFWDSIGIHFLLKTPLQCTCHIRKAVSDMIHFARPVMCIWGYVHKKYIISSCTILSNVSSSIHVPWVYTTRNLPYKKWLF